jgi:hypothetical protein
LHASVSASRQPPDDPTVPDDAILWRRIPPWHVQPDQKRGGRQVTEQSFRDDSDGDPMSAVLATSGREPQEVLWGHDGFGLVSIPVSAVRHLGLGVVRHPEPDEPHHVYVVGDKPRPVRRALRAAAIWVVRPYDWQDVQLPPSP